jgi:L-threonylcarbamoyladenylate synthase
MTNKVKAAADALRAGELVIFPTETVYGLGCDAANPQAVAKLFAAKGRPRFNPLIAHVLDIAAARQEADLPPLAAALAEKFWPGPLTLVARRRPDSAVAELACAGLATIALRAPAHPVARELLAAFGGSVAAPSANRSGKLSTTSAAHAAEDLGDAVSVVLDAGDSPIGIESTIVSVRDDGRAVLLRPGAIAREEIEAIAGPLETPAGGVQAPGMLESHYAPRARLRLDAAAPRAEEAYLAFGAPAPAGGASLSVSGDLVEAAANLYAALRTLDARGAETIAVAPIPATGLGEAIRDRLARAAAPR